MEKLTFRRKARLYMKEKKKTPVLLGCQRNRKTNIVESLSQHLTALSH